jgi:hypothetical protein
VLSKFIYLKSFFISSTKKTLTIAFDNKSTQKAAQMQQIMFHENKKEEKCPQNSFNKIIENSHALEVASSFRQIFIFFLQQIFSSAKHSIPEIKYQIILNEIAKVERLTIFYLQIISQIDKVLVLKVPVVEDEIMKRQVCLVDFSLQFDEAKNGNKKKI